MEKPHRFITDRVAEYAEEGAAFFRRRRARNRSFVRIYGEGGRIDAPDATSSRAKEYFEVARSLIDQVE